MGDRLLTKGDTVCTVRLMCDIPAGATGTILKVYKSGWVKLLYGTNLTGQKIKGLQPINNVTRHLTPHQQQEI